MPSLVSFLMMKRAIKTWEERLNQTRVRRFAGQGSRSELFHGETDVEPSMQLMGDLSCVFNARSPYLCCAIHPDGPCEGCRDYQPR